MDETDLGIDGVGPGTLIGSGGSARVYRARQEALDRIVAVKILAPLDEAGQRRFDRERRAMGRLSAHRGIVTVYEAGVNRYGQSYVIMPLMSRGSLQDAVNAKALHWPQAVELVAEVASTIADAHDDGILHRDLKPGNVLLDDRGNPLVADFGLATIADSATAHRSTQLSFTPGYVPPETLEGVPATAAGDVYSLGATLFALIAGRAPFVSETADGNILALALRVRDEPVPDLRGMGVPDAVCRVFEQAMDKDPARRPTARELAEWLRSAAGGSPAPPPGPVPSYPTTVPSGERPDTTPGPPAAPLAAAGHGGSGTPPGDPGAPSTPSSSGRPEVAAPLAAGLAPGAGSGPGVTNPGDFAPAPSGGGSRALLWVGIVAVVAVLAVVGIVVLGGGDEGAGGDPDGGETDVVDDPDDGDDPADPDDGQDPDDGDPQDPTVEPGDGDPDDPEDPGDPGDPGDPDDPADQTLAPVVSDVIPLSTSPRLPLSTDDGIWTVDPVAGAVTLVRIDTREERTIAVGSRPGLPLEAFDRIWIANRGDGTISVIDPATVAVVATVPAGPGVGTPAEAAGLIFAPNSDDDSISVVDPVALTEIARIPVGDDPGIPTFFDGLVWVPNRGGDTLSVIDPTTLEVVDSVLVGDGPLRPSEILDDLWIANETGGTLSIIRRGARFIGERFEVGAAPRSPVVEGGLVWTAATGEGLIVAIDPETLTPAWELDFGVAARPLLPTVGFGAVWVTLSGMDQVAVVDPATGAFTLIEGVGDEPARTEVHRDKIIVPSTADQTLVVIEPFGG